MNYFCKMVAQNKFGWWLHSIFRYLIPFFTAIDREQIEKRLEIFRDYQDMGVKVPDEVYQFDLHSGCYFNESIQARYGR